MKTNRQDVYLAIDSEREYQDTAWASNAREPRTIAEELLMLEEYVARARKAWTDEPRETEALVTTNVIRKVAAIAVRAMENHGAPGRDGYGVYTELERVDTPIDDVPF